MRAAMLARTAFAASVVAPGAHALVTRSVAGVWGLAPAFIPAQAASPAGCLA